MPTGVSDVACGTVFDRACSGLGALLEEASWSWTLGAGRCCLQLLYCIKVDMLMGLYVMKNPYSILNVSQTATKEEIKAAYRKIAKQTHPDSTGGDEFLAEKFREATQAYEFLMDDYNRQQYAYSQQMEGDAAASRVYEEQTNNSSAPYSAEELINWMYAEIKTANRNASSTLITGIIALALGVGATFVSFMLANEGDTYTVFTGWILVGIIICIRNCARYISAKKRIKEFEDACWKEILGHKPSEQDDLYNNYKQGISAKGERRTTIITVIFFIATLAVVAFMGLTVYNGSGYSDNVNINDYEVTSGNNAINEGATPRLSKEEELYIELVELNDEIIEMENRIERYEAELNEIYENYTQTGNESYYDEYEELYEEYETYFGKYKQKVEIFSEKYDYFENTYGFDE